MAITGFTVPNRFSSGVVNASSLCASVAMLADEVENGAIPGCGILHKTGVASARMTVSRALVRLAREMSYAH